MTAIQGQFTAKSGPLYLAFELSVGAWKLAFTVGQAQAPRLRSAPAGDRQAVLREIARAKERFGLAGDSPVLSCYEAGREGFWLHRWLTREKVANLIVDSASIEVNRRRRRAKSDSLDAAKLVSMLLRYHGGEKKVWSVVNAPTDAAEDERQLHRELAHLKDERTGHINRIKGLLYSQGVVIAGVDERFPTRLPELRRWDGSAVPPHLQERLLREWERWQSVHRQILKLEAQRRQRIKHEQTPEIDKVRRLLQLKGVGLNGAWLLVRELFAWRQIRNGKQLGALSGLTPTPYGSGQSEREQGISKAGNRHVRKVLIELAWCWLRFQPDSALSRWYRARFGKGQRQRKIGIVAVARKLLLALWRYVERGEVMPGAVLVAWEPKVGMKVAA